MKEGFVVEGKDTIKLLEDKLEVLLNMLLCKVVSDMMKLDYNSKYFVYIPKALYLEYFR